MELERAGEVPSWQKDCVEGWAALRPSCADEDSSHKTLEVGHAAEARCDFA